MRKTGAEQDRADSSLLRNQLGEQLLDPVIDLDALHGQPASSRPRSRTDLT